MITSFPNGVLEQHGEEMGITSSYKLVSMRFPSCHLIQYGDGVLVARFDLFNTAISSYKQSSQPLFCGGKD